MSDVLGESKELKELEKEIEERKKRLEVLESGEAKPLMRNFRYVISFEFPFSELAPVPSARVPTDEVTKTFTVKKDTNFYLKSMDVAYSAAGVLALAGSPAATVSYGNIFRYLVFDFVWKARDTGSDREWTNGYVDSRLLLSGHFNGVRSRRGHIFVSGGSEVAFTVGKVFNTNEESKTGLVSISKNMLELSFSGVEVYT